MQCLTHPFTDSYRSLLNFYAHAPFLLRAPLSFVMFLISFSWSDYSSTFCLLLVLVLISATMFCPRCCYHQNSLLSDTLCFAVCSMSSTPFLFFEGLFSSWGSLLFFGVSSLLWGSRLPHRWDLLFSDGSLLFLRVHGDNLFILSSSWESPLFFDWVSSYLRVSPVL